MSETSQKRALQCVRLFILQKLTKNNKRSLQLLES